MRNSKTFVEEQKIPNFFQLNRKERIKQCWIPFNSFKSVYLFLLISIKINNFKITVLINDLIKSDYAKFTFK